MNIGIIGAGIGGLSAAILLAGDGHQVTIYEKNESAGGKMNQVQTDGFRFDTGPSLLTMPEQLSALFSHCGEDMEDYLQLEPLDPLCRYFFPDGVIFDNFDDLQRATDEVRRIAPEDTQAYIDFLNYSSKLYEKTSQSFLFNPLYDLHDFKDVNFTDLTGIDALSTVSRRVDQYFSSSYLRKFFKRFATYNGSSPFKSPATLNVIPHVEINRGGFYVKGGIYRIAEELRRLALQAGTEFHFNTPVASIKMTNGRAAALTFNDGSTRNFDLLVSNADACETYHHLLPKHEVEPLRRLQIEHTEPSCSGFVLLLGIDRKYEQLRHHNVFFSDNYEKEFDAIFNQKKAAEDPTIYIANTSHTDPEHAPVGGSNLFVLVNAPYLTEAHDWSDSKKAYAKLIKNKLEQRGLDDLQNAVKYEKVITPEDFYRQYLSNRGSIYGTSSNSRMAAFMRPANKARGIEGLYLTGGSTHPGGGIPLVILSARHAYKLIKRHER